MSLWTRGVLASAPLVTLTVLLAGCAASDVEVDSPQVSDTDRTTCQRFLAAVPSTLAGEQARTVTPADALGAAWGDPAITLTCGATLPKEFDELSSCVVANRVGWFVPEAQQIDESSAVTWTAVGYRPVVRVDVPPDYRPEGTAAVIAELANAVRAYLELVQPCR